MNFFPRYNITRIGFVVREAALEFSALSICNWGIGGNAIPKLFNEKQALRNAKPLDT